MRKLVIYLSCIFCLVLTITLFFEPASYVTNISSDSKNIQNILCIRSGGWVSHRNKNPDDCQIAVPSQRETAQSAARQLPDLPDPPDNFSDDEDPKNEYSWKKKKYDPEAWSQYQKDCQEQSAKDQPCDLVPIVSRISEDTRLVKFAEKAGSNQQIQKEINDMIEKLRLGNEQCGKGSKTLFRNVKELRSRHGGRVYYRKVNGKIEILAKSNKVKREQDTVIKILKTKY